MPGTWCEVHSAGSRIMHRRPVREGFALDKYNDFPRFAAVVPLLRAESPKKRLNP